MRCTCKDFIAVWSNRRVCLRHFVQEDVRIGDIAHALSHQCRYAGHVGHHYSVGEHSLHVSRAVPPEHALVGLLHDATEAYLVDIPRGVKALPEMVGYRELEARLWRVLASKFSLPLKLPAEVKEVDDRIIEDEWAILRPHIVRGRWWRKREPLGVHLDLWPPHVTEYKFLNRFDELTSRGKKP